MNEEIAEEQVRLIGADGTNEGVVDLEVALEAASSAGLDLVEVAAAAKPVVVKVASFKGMLEDEIKRKKELEKAAKENKASASGPNTKEIRITSTIDDHDLETKLRKMTQFLSKGARLKVTVQYRKPARLYDPAPLEEKVQEVADALADVGSPDGAVRKEGRNRALFFRPI